MGFATVISEDGVYRYSLVRDLGDGEKECLFIMLNPSTADASLNDPTIRRCMGFAKGWGYKTLWVTNLFGFRTPDPTELLTAENPVGKENDGYLAEMAVCAKLVICAWGTMGALAKRGEYIKKFLEVRNVKPHHLGLTKHGFPKHPLYLRADTQPQEWTL